MSKFIGGLITGSVLTLVGVGIAATISAINDGSLSNPFEGWDALSGDDEPDKNDENADFSETTATADAADDDAVTAPRQTKRSMWATARWTCRRRRTPVFAALA